MEKAINISVGFEKGTVLTAEMLANSGKTVSDLMDAIYSDSGNGVLQGLDVIENNGTVLLSGGIIKFEDRLYAVKNHSINLTELVSGLNDNTHYRFGFAAEDPLSGSSINVFSLSPEFAVDFENGVYFAGTYGKNLILPQTLEELCRNYRTCFNLWGCEYYFDNMPAVHPFIARLIKNMLLQKKDLEFLDMMILQQLLSSCTLNLEMLKWYIGGKLSAKESEGCGFKSKDDLRVLVDAINKTTGEAPVIREHVDNGPMKLEH